MTHYHGGTDWQEGGGPEPSEHLDQCPCAAVGVPSCICDDNEECGPQCRHNCICDRLRACEARVEQACHEYEKVARQGQYLAGLTAAREAVAAVSVGGQHFWSVGFRDGTAQALAAIDALKGVSE